MSGKLCRKSSTYVALNKQTGKMYTAEYHARDITNSEALQQVKSTFTKRAKLALSWRKAHKPSTTNAAVTVNYQLVMKAYKGQHKVAIRIPTSVRSYRPNSKWCLATSTLRAALHLVVAVVAPLPPIPLAVVTLMANIPPHTLTLIIVLLNVQGALLVLASCEAGVRLYFARLFIRLFVCAFVTLWFCALLRFGQ